MLVFADRTPPSEDADPILEPAYYVGDHPTINIAASMFHDPHPTVILINSITCVDDARGFVATIARNQLTATLTAPTGVNGPAGVSTWEVKAVDLAGNKQIVTYVIPIVERPTPVLSTNLVAFPKTAQYVFVGGPASFSSPSCTGAACEVTFNIEATFASAVVVDSGTPPTLTVSTTSGSGSATVSYQRVSSNGRFVTFEVRTTAAHGTEFTFIMPLGAVAAANGAGSAASASLVVRIDREGPTEDTSVTTNHVFSMATPASVGIPYIANISAIWLGDAWETTYGFDYRVKASTHAFNGLNINAGTSTGAQITGVINDFPPGGKIKLTAYAVDTAGNSGAAPITIEVTVNPKPAVIIKVPSNNLNTQEGAADLTLAPSVEYIGTVTDTVADSVTFELSGYTDFQACDETLVMGADSATCNAGVATLTKTGTFSAAEFKALLATLKYRNNNARTLGGPRFVVGRFFKNNVPVGTWKRQITVTPVNNAPATTLGAAPANLAGSDVSIFPAVGATLTDDDDSKLATVRVIIATTASAGNFAACDKTKDRLRLLSTYASSPVIKSVWDQPSCALLLTPLMGNTAAISDFEAALHAVEFYSLTQKDPVADKSGAAGSLVRQLTIEVEDGGSNGAVAFPARSTSSEILVTFDLTDDEPTVNYEALYGEGGVLHSSDEYANSAVLSVSALRTAYHTRKFSALMPEAPETSTVTEIKLDLTNSAPNYFAGRGIYDVDSPTALASDPTIMWQDDDGVLQPLSGLPTEVQASFVFSSTAPSVLTVTVTDEAEPMNLLLALQLSTNTRAYFGVDVRQYGCTLKEATNYALNLTANPDNEGRNIDEFYYDNQRCTYNEDDGVVTAASDLYIRRGDYLDHEDVLTTRDGALEAAGAENGDRVKSVTEERKRARASLQLYVPANAVATAGTLRKWFYFALFICLLVPVLYASTTIIR
jgi:hypothetical protein